MSVIGRALLSALCLWFSAAVVVPQVAGGNDSSNDQFTLQIPVSGIEGVDWIIGQYYDHDATGESGTIVVAALPTMSIMALTLGLRVFDGWMEGRPERPIPRYMRSVLRG